MRRTLLALLGAAVIGLTVWGLVVEPVSLRNERYEIVLPHWPPGCDGITVAVLSDLHVGSPFNRIAKLAKIVDLTQRAQPQLILLAGDFVIQGVVGGQFTPPEDIAAGLGQLRAPLGVWAVLGNHDWWLDGPRVQRALESAGIRVLDNAAAPVSSG
ncbi:MAG: metallophosphoesterase, partial [Vicinamibacterales bacterium]